MRPNVAAALFILLVAAAGLGGYAILARVGLDDAEAWAGGRTAGLVAVAFAGWWPGVAGLAAWRTVGAAFLVAGTVWGALTLWQRRARWRQLVAAEAVVAAGTVVVLLLRLDHPEISGTEKPMDMGILATLLRAEGFPPPDMWLAGESLPYYYWGALLWTVPLALSRVSLEVGYNLVVALLGGLLAGSVWSLGRRLTGSSAAGVGAALLALFAGTPDGLRQLLAGTPVTGLDFWHSSRQVADTITEWPLFTLWLGDLHPHLLSMPVQVVALLVAAELGRRGPRLPHLLVLAVLVGSTWAANPWALPPTLAGVALLVLSGDGTWHWPAGAGLMRWAAAAGVAVAAWLVTAPFHLGFHPPFQGIGLVHAWTPPLELLLYAGALLVPLAAATFSLLAASFGPHRERARTLTLTVLAAGVLAAAVSGRPTLVLLVVALGVLTAAVTRGEADTDRPALALAALGVFMLVVPEILFVRDPYGDQLHRMNTVFKAYLPAWLLLALAAPVLLRRGFPRASWRRAAVAVMLLAALPHFLGMASGLLSGRPLGLDGLRHLDAGDRAMIAHLRLQPPGTTLVEAVGGAYTEYARLSAGSGVPAFLGWANHEGVWRGSGVNPELERRETLVGELFASGDPDTVRSSVTAAGVDLVAVGTLERQTYPEPGIEAVLAVAEPVFESEGAVLLRVPSATGAHGGGDDAGR